MKKCDVLILYESKVREFESVCLLKYELERRNLKVVIENTWKSYYLNFSKVKAKLTVVPSMYHDGIFGFVSQISYRPMKIVNLQWEQIGTNGDVNNALSRFNLRGVASECLNICWGFKTYNRLKTVSKINDEHLSICGNISLDFCRGEFGDFFLDKKSLFKKYSIPLTKKPVLFISSFSYVTLPKSQIDESEILDKKAFIDFSVNSFSGILEWISQLLSVHNDLAFIYRPHPAEMNDIRLLQLEQKFKGSFFLIKEESVKQWIKCVDCVFTWYSTSFVESYFLNKTCYILRPVEVPTAMEVEIFNHYKKICSFEDFERAVYSQKFSLNVSNDLDNYYYIDSTPAFVKIADEIERVLKHPSFGVKNYFDYDNLYGLQKESFKQTIAVLLFKLRNHLRLDDYTKQQIKKNNSSYFETQVIVRKIKRIMTEEKYEKF